MSTPTAAPAVSSGNEVSNTRLYLGNLPKDVTKADIEAFFGSHGTGEILEIKLMNGFGFIEYKDAMDARDVVPAFHGVMFMNMRLTVQFARGGNRNTREPGNPGGGGGPVGDRSERGGGASNGAYGHSERPPPRPRRTAHRMTVTGLQSDTSWQDLKDFARKAGVDVVYSETSRSGEGSVEFESAQDLAIAIEKLNNKEFRDKVVTCTANSHTDFHHRRSRSPVGRRPYPPHREDYDRRGPPPMQRGYSPRRDGPGYRENYRDRSPRRDYYDPRPYPHSPRRGPMDDYPPPQRPRYDDPYRRDYPPPPPAVPYDNRGPYERPPPMAREFPVREPAYPRENGYPRDYERRYW